MRSQLHLLVALLLVLGVAVPVLAHEETEVEVPGGELELKVDRPTVMLGDEIEVEVELEIEGEAPDPDDESEPEDEETEPDDEEIDPEDDESEPDGDESEPDDDESEGGRPDDLPVGGPDTDDDESDAPGEDDEDTIAPDQVPTSVTFSVDYGDGTTEDLALTKERHEGDAEEAEFEAEAEGTHTYAAVGTYTLTVTATPDVGEPITATLEVTVVEDPVAYDAPIDEVCPEDGLPTAAFGDVSAGSVHQVAIDCLAERGIVAGKAAGRFAPADDVSRAQIATLLANLLSDAGVELPAGADRFDDDEDSPHEAAINALAEAGVLSGKGDDFDPDGTLTRGQMAALLLRALEHATGAPTTTGLDYFADDEGSVHEDAIDRAAAAGIATGRSLGRFDPDAPVTREQVSTFLARLLALVSPAAPGA